MSNTKAFAAFNATDNMGPLNIERRALGPRDVAIDIQFCGVCHSDLHQVRNEWGGTVYPIVPGHEIVGKVTAVGSEVRKFKAGDTAGVGCLVDSCRSCDNCKKGLEQFCRNGSTGTYNAPDKRSGGVTYGGYSKAIVADEDFVLRISDKLPLNAAAPLLCAGITTYSPLRHWNVGKGSKVAVLGLGGLGHMGIKFAAAFGAEVTMLSRSEEKRADAAHLGAHHFVLTTDAAAMAALAGSFDFILDTVSAPHDYNQYLQLLNTDGAMVCVGAPPTPSSINAFALIGGRKTLAGSLIGGLPETQEMLDFCAEHNIVCDVEMIDIKDINQAYERMLKADVRYRFVIDMASL